MPAKKYSSEEERKAAAKARRDAWSPEKKAQIKAYRDARRPAYGEQERAYAKAYDEKNREQRRLAAAARRAADPEHTREINRVWRERNPEKAKQFATDYRRAWRAENPGKHRMAQARRAGIDVSDGDLTLEQWNEIQEDFLHCCAFCNRSGLKLEVEHLTPVTRGGQNTKMNVVPCCRSCNSTKSKRNLLEAAGLTFAAWPDAAA